MKLSRILFLFSNYICILFITIFLTASCSGIQSTFSTVKKPSEEECFKRLIAEDINSNPKLSEIPVLVESVSGGNIKLKISASSNLPISDKTIAAIGRGENLQTVQRSDSSINFLVDFEKQLKRMSAVKTVSWTADAPCAPGFVCQTTCSSERSADEDEIDILCAEYRK